MALLEDKIDFLRKSKSNTTHFSLKRHTKEFPFAINFFNTFIVFEDPRLTCSGAPVTRGRTGAAEWPRDRHTLDRAHTEI